MTSLFGCWIVVAPLFCPAAGALIEAHRATGLDVASKNVPETEK